MEELLLKYFELGKNNPNLTLQELSTLIKQDTDKFYLLPEEEINPGNCYICGEHIEDERSIYCSHECYNRDNN